MDLDLVNTRERQFKDPEKAGDVKKELVVFHRMGPISQWTAFSLQEPRGARANSSRQSSQARRSAIIT